MGYCPCFCETNVNLVHWQRLQFLVSSWGVRQIFLMKFYFCTSSLKTVHKWAYYQKAVTWISCDCEVRAISFCKERADKGLVKRLDQTFQLNILMGFNFNHPVLKRQKNLRLQDPRHASPPYVWCSFRALWVLGAIWSQLKCFTELGAAGNLWVGCWGSMAWDGTAHPWPWLGFQVISSLSEGGS